MSSPDTSGYLKQWAEMRYIKEQMRGISMILKRKQKYLILRNSTDSSSQNVRQKENV